MPTREENRIRQAEAHFRLFETAKNYFDRVGKIPSVAQLKYWGRGGKRYMRVYLKNILSIRRFLRGLKGGWFRYTLIARISGSDEWKREYYIEFKLVYHRLDKRPFNQPIFKERQGARYAMEKAAHHFKAHVPDNAITSAEEVERDASYAPGDPALFTVRDNKRLVEQENEEGELTLVPYEFIGELENIKVLEWIDSWKG